MRQFDFYEFAGVIVPGTVGIYGAGMIWPDQVGKLHEFDISLGGFGIAVILAYTAGHLIQAFGNFLEFTWWKLFGGAPSNWPLTNKGALLSTEQRHKLEVLVRSDLGYPDFTFEQSRSVSQWHPIFREICAVVQAAGRDNRAHTFNGNYGMFRGIASAGFVAAMVAFLSHGFHSWRLALAFTAVGVLAIIRMHRFAKHYACETFVQFLSLSSTEEKHQ